MARTGDGLVKRGRSWWLDFRYQGVRYQVRLGSEISKTVAREIAGVKRSEILKGNAGIARKKKDIGFKTAAEQFMKWAEANRKPKSVKSYTEFLAPLKSFLGERKLSQISVFLLEKYKLERFNDGAKVAVNRELALLKNVINRAKEWGKYEGENTVEKVQFLKETRGRTRFLEVSEETALLSATTSDTHRTLWLTAIYTGCRLASEILTLKKEDINLNRRTLTVQAAFAKNGATKTVPLASILVEPLRCQMQRSESDWVFVQKDRVTPIRDIRTAFETARKNAKLSKDVTPHTLRHTFASRLAMSGQGLRTIQELGGWKTIAMVERYSHISDTHKAQAIETLCHFTTLSTTAEKSQNDDFPQVVAR